MQAHIENTRRQLGELGAMAKQTEDMERRILARAQERLSEVDGQISDARVAALTGDDAAKQRYTDLVDERGRLHQVIAQAREALGNA
ncbi:hypothetical protein [Bordetella phage vB_BbrM_PHB04]|uniref:Uncharacterized protein n=1 Tax=Bordetella phage vB_BbrM_PHB04 TaxID=2029657 RepID=A0A291L9W4_9CAUD|nr:hypothetical protein HOS14_gp023 [Bordetella phage vB_BbrM_PHB04]ATI15641.1 hypothetical protein [Bordetella phage vB_BbrM_PHB04]